MAYRIKTRADGVVELHKEDADSVICRNYAAIPPSPEELKFEEIPADYPSDIPIPAYQNGVIPLSSFLGATAVLYLDFDGEKGPHKVWGDFDVESFNLSNDHIKRFWSRVAEEFAPFNINVTTDLTIYQNAPSNRRIHCIITPTDTARPGVGGVAITGSFGHDYPCWVFESGARGAVAAAHEPGHVLGLDHDGLSYVGNNSYFGGHGDYARPESWGPIMGNPYYREVTQWSKGEYAYANEHQDDIAIIAANPGVGFRTDDHGATLATASLLEVFPNNSTTNRGIIGTATDYDDFKFTLTAASTVSFTVHTAAPNPGSAGANLNAKLELRNSSGAVVATGYSERTLDASLETTLGAGEYQILVTGVNCKDGRSEGFTAYGSLGFYTLTGTVPNAIQPQRFSVPEKSTFGTLVGQIIPRNDHGSHSLTFSISKNDTAAFSIQSTTGNLTILNSAAFNYELLSTGYDDPATLEILVAITDATTPALNETVRVVVAVTNENEPPTISGGRSVTFLEHSQRGTAVAQLSSTDPDRYDFANFSITSGNTGNTFAVDPSGLITFAADTDVSVQSDYHLIVTAADHGTPPLTATTAVDIHLLNIADGYAPGTVVHAVYNSVHGTNVVDLTDHSRFPIRPNSATETSAINYETTSEYHYGDVFCGYLLPPASGNYTFWIAANNTADFYLSSDAQPIHMARICRTTAPTGVHQWTKYSSQKSTTKTLVAGQPYYFEARHKKSGIYGGNSSHISIAWQGPSLSRQVVSAKFTAPYYPNYIIDFDNDSLNDDWERTHYGETNQVSATTNTDGDRYSAFHEMVFALDPAVNDSTNAPIRIRQVEKNGVPVMQVQFRRPQNHAFLHVTYTLQTCTDLDADLWVDETSTPAILREGQIEWVSFSLPLSDPQTRTFARCNVSPAD